MTFDATLFHRFPDLFISGLRPSLKKSEALKGFDIMSNVKIDPLHLLFFPPRGEALKKDAVEDMMQAAYREAAIP